MSFGGGGGGRGHHCVLNYLRTDPRMSFHSQPTRSKPPSKGFLEKGVVWKLNTWGSGGGLWFILRFSLIRRAFSGSALGKQFRLICKFEVISQNTRKSRRRLPYTPPPAVVVVVFFALDVNGFSCFSRRQNSGISTR